jgi:hypothetical protein
VAVEGAVLGAEPSQCFMQDGLVLLHLDQQAISAARVKLSFWQCSIGGEQHAPSSVISVGTAGISPGPLLVGQDEGGVAGKRAEHMSRCPVVQVIEAAAQRLAIEGDGALPGHLPFNASA